jgi:hypothetical protein
MVITGRSLLLGLSAVVAAVGVVMWIDRQAHWLALVAAGCGLLSIVILNIAHPPQTLRRREPEDIEQLLEQRRRELVRGTSLYLREMHYRYSVRADQSDHQAFTHEINTLRIGFVPVVITDNHTDRQGYGYVAFVYDGKRWRGPGLPCGGGPEEAVAHAARCVAPLPNENEVPAENREQPRHERGG